MASKKSSKPRPSSESRSSRGRVREGAIFTVITPKLGLPASYSGTLQEIKTHLRSARVRAVLAANPIVIEAYWHTGKIILQRQQEAAWGAKVIDRLAADLREAFPEMSELSARNLLAMKIFAREFPDGSIAQQSVAQLPWGHVLQLMQRLKDPAARDFYINQTLTHGWSRSILELQIQNQLVVEYALSGLDKSIAVADWKKQITETLPAEFQGSLPTIEEIEAELVRTTHTEEKPT